MLTVDETAHRDLPERITRRISHKRPVTFGAACRGCEPTGEYGEPATTEALSPPGDDSYGVVQFVDGIAGCQEGGELRVEIGQARADQPADVRTRGVAGVSEVKDIEEVADLGQAQPRFPAAADELQAPDRLGAVVAVAPRGPRRSR
jgi:hypothetical protein